MPSGRAGGINQLRHVEALVPRERLHVGGGEQACRRVDGDRLEASLAEEEGRGWRWKRWWRGWWEEVVEEVVEEEEVEVVEEAEVVGKLEGTSTPGERTGS